MQTTPTTQSPFEPLQQAQQQPNTPQQNDYQFTSPLQATAQQLQAMQSTTLTQQGQLVSAVAARYGATLDAVLKAHGAQQNNAHNYQLQEYSLAQLLDTNWLLLCVVLRDMQPVAECGVQVQYGGGPLAFVVLHKHLIEPVVSMPQPQAVD